MHKQEKVKTRKKRSQSKLAKVKIQAAHRNCSSKGCPSQGRHREMLSICVVLYQILAMCTHSA